MNIILIPLYKCEGQLGMLRILQVQSVVLTVLIF